MTKGSPMTMKVGGVENSKGAVYGPIVFNRGDAFLAFFAQPVWDYDEFDALCPMPKNRYVRFTKEGKETDPDNPAFKEEMVEYNRKRWGYTILKSLEPSELEMDGISLADPNTWASVESVLRQELAVFEFTQVMSLIDQANALDEDKLAANVETFFQRRAAAEESSENCQRDEVASS